MNESWSAPGRSTSAAAPVAKLIEELNRLPGIGPKSAQRLAYHLLRATNEEARALADAIVDVKERIKLCSVCQNTTDVEPCLLCSDESRERTRRQALPRFVAAQQAGLDVGRVLADAAQLDALLDVDDGVGQGAGLFVGGAQQVVGEALGALGADARQAVELLDELGDGRGGAGAASRGGPGLVHASAGWLDAPRG